MDPVRLRILRELGDRGSVVAVAAAMHVSPSAVSQQLAVLQSGIPVALTEREGRRLVLTEAGQALATASIQVDRALAQAADAVEAYLQHSERVVRVSAFHSAGITLFGPLLAALADGPPIALADADVGHGEFPGLTADYDLVIAHRLSHDPQWPTERITVTPLYVEPLEIAMHAGHPLASQPHITPEQLRGQRWVSTHPGFPLAGVLQHLGALAGEAPTIDHRINEFSVAAEVVRTGAAIAVMPRTSAAAVDGGGLVLRPVAGARLARHVDVLARPDAAAHSAVRTVRTVLCRVAAATAARASSAS